MWTVVLLGEELERWIQAGKDVYAQIGGRGSGRHCKRSNYGYANGEYIETLSRFL